MFFTFVIASSLRRRYRRFSTTLDSIMTARVGWEKEWTQEGEDYAGNDGRWMRPGRRWDEEIQVDGEGFEGMDT